MTLNPDDYELWQFKEISKIIEYPEPSAVVIKCHERKATIIDGGTNLEMASDLSLATRCPAFRFIRMSISITEYNIESCSEKTDVKSLALLSHLLKN